eukprot:scaffold21167_cov33-Tisochrysis_lutea.AAC.3
MSPHVLADRCARTMQSICSFLSTIQASITVSTTTGFQSSCSWLCALNCDLGLRGCEWAFRGLLARVTHDALRRRGGD